MRLEAAGWAPAAQAHGNPLVPFIKQQQVLANAANLKFPERVNFEPSEPKHNSIPSYTLIIFGAQRCSLSF